MEEVTTVLGVRGRVRVGSVRTTAGPVVIALVSEVAPGSAVRLCRSGAVIEASADTG
jgi:hypothetical protein